MPVFPIADECSSGDLAITLKGEFERIEYCILGPANCFVGALAMEKRLGPSMPGKLASINCPGRKGSGNCKRKRISHTDRETCARLLIFARRVVLVALQLGDRQLWQQNCLLLVRCKKVLLCHLARELHYCANDRRSHSVDFQRARFLGYRHYEV